MNDQLCGAGKFDSIDGHSFSGNWQGGILCALFTVCATCQGRCVAQETIWWEKRVQYMQMVIDIRAKFEDCVGMAEGC